MPDTTSAEENLRQLGIVLPPAWTAPRGMNFVTSARSGNLLFLSGHGPTRPPGDPAGPVVVGRIGRDLDVEAGYAAARLTGLNLLATMRSALGSLDRVARIVKVLGMVACTEDFQDTPKVVNGASDLFVEVFGPEIGRHARSAVGMQALPSGMPVEVEMIVEVRE